MLYKTVNIFIQTYHSVTKYYFHRWVFNNNDKIEFLVVYGNPQKTFSGWRRCSFNELKAAPEIIKVSICRQINYCIDNNIFNQLLTRVFLPGTLSANQQNILSNEVSIVYPMHLVIK
jgi:hypothetical protein